MNEFLRKRHARHVTLKRGISFTVGHPKHAAVLLSKAFHTEAFYHKSFDAKMKLVLAEHLINYITHPDFDTGFSKTMIEKISKYPLSKAIRLATRYPENGIQILAILLHDQLKNVQRLPDGEILSFVNTLLEYALEELKRDATEPHK
jgi:hypothetical protein